MTPVAMLNSARPSLPACPKFVRPSVRWGDPRVKLLLGSAWESARPHICRILGREEKAAAEIAALTRRLDETYRRTAANLPTNTAVRLETQDGRETITLTGLDKLEEPASLVTLRERVAASLPRIDLPEALLEIQARTGFASEFTHISEGAARVTDLAVSLCAVLLPRRATSAWRRWSALTLRR